VRFSLGEERLGFKKNNTLYLIVQLINLYIMDQTEEKFSRILKYMGIPKEEVRPDASFINDFEFNEFQFNCLVYYITNYFDIPVRESDYPEINTIGNTMNFIRRKISVSEYRGNPVRVRKIVEKVNS
jgi:acyl carrier protein